jgi:hypothetical protein
MTTPADRLLEAARTILGGGDPMAERERLTAALTARLPMVSAEIAALGAALSLGAGGRLARTTDVEDTVARLADDVVLLTGGSIETARVGAALAARLHGHPIAVPDFGPAEGEAAEPGSASWVGATEVVPPGVPAGAAPAPAEPAATAAPPPDRAAAPTDGLLGTVVAGRPIGEHLRDPKVLAGLAIVIGLLFYAPGGRETTPAPSGGPPSAPEARPTPAPSGPSSGQPAPARPARPPQGAPAAGPQPGLPPTLVAPADGATLPTLHFEQNDTAYFYAFGLPTDTGATMVGVLMTNRATAWSLGQFGVFEPGGQEPRAVTRPTAFTLEKLEGAVVRKMQTAAWVKNEIGVDGVCVAALARGPDVPVRGFRLCVLGPDCRRMIGCGEIP